MQRGGAYVAEVMKMMEHVESKEDSPKQIVTTHQHHTNSTQRYVKQSRILSKVKQSKEKT
jgi:3-deoxy-D-arabino-heptulosonate 7-phosphate (DAHP) synthase